MAGIFKKNPKRIIGAPTRGPRVQEGIENLQKQPTKGILKYTEPLPDYLEPSIDYDSGYESGRSNKSKRDEPFIPAPDYESEESKNRARDNWNKLINKFKRAVIPEQYKAGGLTEAIADSVQVKITQQENYLREIGQGKHIHGSAEFDMLRMKPEELKTCRLSYDKSRQALLDHTGKPATTIGKKSKDMEDIQAFVMSKEGEIYIASHKGVYEADKKIPNLSHASFLEGRPAEMAGMIGILDNGKIGYISDNSGHYQPEDIDMYRGIKKIQETMPGALDKNCLIDRYGEKRMLVSEFIAQMEIKVPGAGGKTHYEVLREERIAKIEAYEDKLKNISKPSVKERATRIGKDLKETLLKKKQEDQKAAREIAINARKSKKETQIRR